MRSEQGSPYIRTHKECAPMTAGHNTRELHHSITPAKNACFLQFAFVLLVGLILFLLETSGSLFRVSRHQGWHQSVQSLRRIHVATCSGRGQVGPGTTAGQGSKKLAREMPAADDYSAATVQEMKGSEIQGLRQLDNPQKSICVLAQTWRICNDLGLCPLGGYFSCFDFLLPPETPRIRNVCGQCTGGYVCISGFEAVGPPKAPKVRHLRFCDWWLSCVPYPPLLSC